MDLAAMEIKSRRELVQFEADMRLQAAKLGQAWELEKMQRESELDFQFEQQKLTLARSAVVQKQSMAKDQYLSYVDHIEGDSSLTTEEKGTFKRMAYDKMMGGLDVADRVYFPEAYAEGGTLSNFMGAGTDKLYGPQTQQEATPGSDADWIKQARLGLPQNATAEMLADKAEELKAVDKYEAEISQASKFTMSPAEVKAKAIERYTDDKVKAGYEKSKTLGYKPTLYQKWEESVNLSRPTKAMNPAIAQRAADKAREASDEGAIKGIIREWFSPTSVSKAEQAARRKRYLGILKQQGGYRDRSEMIKQGFPALGR
jgi:hypothetical protein